MTSLEPHRTKWSGSEEKARFWVWCSCFLTNTSSSVLSSESIEKFNKTGNKIGKSHRLQIGRTFLEVSGNSWEPFLPTWRFSLACNTCCFETCSESNPHAVSAVRLVMPEKRYPRMQEGRSWRSFRRDERPVQPSKINHGYIWIRLDRLRTLYWETKKSRP